MPKRRPKKITVFRFELLILGIVYYKKAGAFTYNLLHHKGFAIALLLIGIYLVNEPLQFIGALLFGHSSFDRMLGYGLKYSDSFQNTHLGWMGKGVPGKY